MELVSPNTSSQKISQYLISKINKPYKSLSIKEKIDVSAEIILNRQYIISQEVFLQEEVQATLLNWIWKIRKNIDSENFEFFHLNDLLFNIIIIFETFPIQTDTLISCHFLRKLNDIYREVKQLNSALACRLQNLLNYWEEQINIIKLDKFLNKKRERVIEKDELAVESENDSEDTQCSVPKIDKKNVIWKKNFVEIIEINTKEEPYNI